MSLGLCPRDITRVSGNLLGIGDGFPNTSLVLMEHGYIAHPEEGESILTTWGFVRCLCFTTNLNCPIYLWHSLRLYRNIIAPDPWKWSNGVGKSEMSIVWCMDMVGFNTIQKLFETPCPIYLNHFDDGRKIDLIFSDTLLSLVTVVLQWM